MFIFNKVICDGSDFYYGNSGAGDIKFINDVSLSPPIKPPINFAGFAKLGDYFYVAIPDENAVVCRPSCDDLDFSNLEEPLDNISKGRMLPEVRAEIPQEYQDIVDRMLAVDPAERYSSCEEATFDLNLMRLSLNAAIGSI